MLLLVLLVSVVSCQAGLLFSEVPLTSASTNIHSPSAFSHQSITHIHTNDLQGVHKPESLLLHKTPLHTYFEESSSVGNVVFPSDFLAGTEAEHFKSNEYETSSPYISYKDNTPVFIGHTHTPAHLAYAARPIVYKMLPQTAPYGSYEAFLPSPRVISYK